MTKRLIRLRGVLERTGDNKSTIYQKMAAGQFPRPVPIGERAVAWIESEIDAYIDACIANRDEVTP